MKFIGTAALGLVLLAGCAGEEAATTTSEQTATAVAESSEATAPADSERRNPCSYITETEATEALGQPSKYRSNNDDGSSNCIIEHVDDPTAVSVDFKVMDDPYIWPNALADTSAEKVEGLGDEALWDGAFLTIRKGDLTFQGYFTGNAENMKDRAIAFGRVVAEKM